MVRTMVYLIISCSYPLACDYADNSPDFHSFPIYAGILCDGVTLFFSDRNTPEATFSSGVFRRPNSESIATPAVAIYGSKSNIEFIYSLRLICDTLFYFLFSLTGPGSRHV